jgi:competence protein ComEC
MHPRASGRALLPGFLILVVIAAILLAGCSGIPSWNRGTSLQNNTTGDLKVYFLDVGQGDSSVILFKDKVILIDAGEIESGDRVVSDLTDLGVTRIDLLIATHPHSDHIGGMRKVLARFPVDKVLDSDLPSTSALYERFLATVQEKDIPYVVAKQGQEIAIDPSLGVLVLWPPEERTGDDLNADSIVLRLSYGTVNVLFTGDAGTGTESAMSKTGYPVDAQILKVSHHGSSDASSAAFLGRVRPEIAVISLGADNEYGHPHRETLERLAVAGPLVFRTDLNGTILVESNGATYSVTTEKGSSSFWSRTRTATAMPGTTTPPVHPATSGTATPVVPFTLPVTLPAVPSNITVPDLTVPSLQVGNASDVSISAVQFDAPGDDTKNLNGEWVRLTNSGNEVVLLTSWTLSDRSSAEPYRFPAFLLMPGESVTVYTGSGIMNDTALYMGKTVPLWGNSGDRATLRDGSGNIIGQWPAEAGSS